MDVKRSKIDGFMLRFPDGLRDRIKAAADTNSRSMNSEIISRLEESLIDEMYSERMERLAVERELNAKAHDAKAVESRLSALEEKIDNLVARLTK